MSSIQGLEYLIKANEVSYAVVVCAKPKGSGFGTLLAIVREPEDSNEVCAEYAEKFGQLFMEMLGDFGKINAKDCESGLKKLGSGALSIDLDNKGPANPSMN